MFMNINLLGDLSFKIYNEEGKHNLLLSCKYWPVVLAVDMVCDVVSHIECRQPTLAHAIWGERWGCFKKPTANKKTLSG